MLKKRLNTTKPKSTNLYTRTKTAMVPYRRSSLKAQAEKDYQAFQQKMDSQQGTDELNELPKFNAEKSAPVFRYLLIAFLVVLLLGLLAFI